MFKIFCSASNILQASNPIYRPSQFSKFSSRNYNENLPQLLYYSNPFKRALTKLHFIFLKFSWDPEFSEKEFKMGATKAAALMSDFIRTQDVKSIQKHTTLKGFEQITNDSFLSKKDPRLNLLRFRAVDAKKVQTLRVHFVETSDGTNHLFVDTFVAFLRTVDNILEQNNHDCHTLLLDIKQIEDGIRERFNVRIPNADEARRVLLAEIFTRFHREYSEQATPEWNIELFRIVGLKILYDRRNATDV